MCRGVAGTYCCWNQGVAPAATRGPGAAPLRDVSKHAPSVCKSGPTPAAPTRRVRDGPAITSQNQLASIEAPTVENLLDALLPRVVTAAMHTTAMSATSSAYS